MGVEEKQKEEQILNVKFNEEINYYKKKGIVLAHGDLNVRTGKEKGFIEYDKFDDTFGIENDNKQRNSENEITNSRRKRIDVN